MVLPFFVEIFDFEKSKNGNTRVRIKSLAGIKKAPVL